MEKKENDKCGFLTPVVNLKGKAGSRAGVTFKVEKCDYVIKSKEDYVEHLGKIHKVFISDK
jgi:uncharacterized C2H2 Zn-finger protein